MKISAGPARTTERPPFATLGIEVSGGVLSWDLGASTDSAHLHLWSAADADWLWRIVGEDLHAGLLTGATATDLDVATAGSELSLLHRLAWGHWLRRWWPASRIDAIDELSGPVLDVEVALLTAECDAFFDVDSLDGDPHAVLAAHPDGALDSLATHVDADVRELYRNWLMRGGELPPPVESVRTSIADDYALAAGPPATAPRVDAIAAGSATLAWESVPAHLFDAAEDTITWAIDTVPDVVADIAVALLPDRIAPQISATLTLSDPAMRRHAQLAPDGTARIALPLTAAQAWRADWSTLRCRVADTAPSDGREQRAHVRTVIRRRLSGAADGLPLFRAEQLLADADY